jgi:Fur family zinc uptake transcriptional regulator
MTASSQQEPHAFGAHDHRQCRGRALAAVEAACAARRLRLTPARAFVLERLLESHRAMTAYELLEKLGAAGLGSQPPVVYRALDFLVANGFAHRIERLGAFAACTQGGAEHNAGFLVCRACRRVAETAMPRPARGLVAEAAASGFAIERTVVEAEGLCARCRQAAA